MQKVLRTVPKNRWFVKKVWIPMSFIQEAEVAEVKVDAETQEIQVTPVSTGVQYEEVRVGFGQRVYCMISQSLKSPTPVFKYMSIDRAESQWLQDAVNIITAESLETSEEAANATARELMKRYTMNSTAMEAINDFFKDALGKEIE